MQLFQGDLVKNDMNTPIRVLAVVYKLLPAGLENRLMDIIRNIDHNRIQIDVFTYQMEQGIYDDEVRSLGGKVYYNPPLTIKNMFWYVNYFKRFLEKHTEYKIIHAHQDAWCSVFCRGAYLAKVPIRIAHARTAITLNGSKCLVKDFVKNIVKIPTKKYANYYFAVSDKAGKWLYGDKLYNEGKVQVWPNAIDADKFYFNQEIRLSLREKNQWNDKYVVMHVGNFTPPKNHPFILEVFKEIHLKNPDSVLVLVGDGDRACISTCIERYNLGNSVQLLGSRRDVHELLQAADVFLFPSIFEGLPGALVEAQAAGLPCVISDTITKDVYILPTLIVLPLSQGCKEWAEKVLQCNNSRRESARKYIEAKGFDIHSLTEKLCCFYEDAYKKGMGNDGLI